MTAGLHPRLGALQAAGLASGDTRNLLRVNDFAHRTPLLHRTAVTYANDGVGLFAILLLVGWFLARRHADTRLMAHALLAPVGVLLAVGVNQPIVHAVNARQLPKATLRAAP